MYPWIAYILALPSTIFIVLGILLFLTIFFLFLHLVRRPRRAGRNKPGRQPKPQAQKPGSAPQPPSTPQTVVTAAAVYLYLEDERGQRIDLKELPVTIGRAAENQVALKDEAVSDIHAKIYHDQALQSVCIEDLDSTNGLYVNGLPTRKNVLQDGARIELGSSILIFHDLGYLPPENQSK